LLDSLFLSFSLSLLNSAPYLLRHLALERRPRQYVTGSGHAQGTRAHGPAQARGAGHEQQQRRDGAPAGAALGDGRRRAAVVALGVAVIVAVGLWIGEVGSF